MCAPDAEVLEVLAADGLEGAGDPLRWPDAVEYLKQAVEAGDCGVLHVLALLGDARRLKLVLENVGQLDVDVHSGQGRRALDYAASGGHLECVRLLLEAGTSARALPGDECPPIVFAPHGGVAVVDALLRAGADPREARPRDGLTALHPAATLGLCGVVELLLERGADPLAGAATHHSESALDEAVHEKQHAVVALLQDAIQARQGKGA